MAIKISNKRNLCTVDNQDSQIKLSGELTIEGTQVHSFNGSYYRLSPEEYIGGFDYSETSDDRITKSISGIPSDLVASAIKLLDDSITEIKASEEI